MGRECSTSGLGHSCHPEDLLISSGTTVPQRGTLILCWRHEVLGNYFHASMCHIERTSHLKSSGIKPRNYHKSQPC